ncbi:NusG domain II-containing protein [Defluviitalea phaphyphila]|uniref:NusG domain II-containing protein n=1 Tax=Defluviitalea phaphyphila TaxID=1473580 RepID=UPI00072FFAD5|nr:NusG domain II-containing protein [Defluviitalea phaphyphila]
MKKGDKIVGLIIIILITISLLFLGIYRFINKGDKLIAKIIQDQEVIKVIDLDKVEEPKEWTIENEEGHHNTIRVEKGRIRFIEADCPDLVCVNSGWLSKPGDIAVCIPNKILIRIEGKDDEVDQISY